MSTLSNQTDHQYAVQPFRVLIVDDSEEARAGMRMIIEASSLFQIVGEAASGREALIQCEKCMPDIILMDINMPGSNGLETTQQLKVQFPYVKVVIVTVSDDIAHLFEALKRGAQGYLLKNLNPELWIDYLEAIALDEVPMSKHLAFQLLKEFSTINEEDDDLSLLTRREKEILQLVAKGDSNKEIAIDLQISEHTVKNHMKNIMQKLHLENRVQLARYAYESGWIKT